MQHNGCACNPKGMQWLCNPNRIQCGRATHTGYNGCATHTYNRCATHGGCSGCATHTGYNGCVTQTAYHGCATQTGCNCCVTHRIHWLNISISGITYTMIVGRKVLPLLYRTSRKVDEARRPHHTCSRTNAFEEKNGEKKHEIPPHPKHTTKSTAAPGDRDHLETACDGTDPTREPVLARFHRCRFCRNRPRIALAMRKKHEC